MSHKKLKLSVTSQLDHVEIIRAGLVNLDQLVFETAKGIERYFHDVRSEYTLASFKQQKNFRY